jgi:EthD domain
MIRLFFPMRRLPHLSLEEFLAHWLDVHAVLNEPFRLIRRYVQYHRLADDPTREVLAKAALSRLEPYDGIPSAWYDTLDDMILEHDVDRTPYAAPAVKDHFLFIDDSRSVACFTDEHPLVEPNGAAPYVLVGCLRRRAGVEPAAFQRAWLGLADIVRAAHAEGLIAGLVQNHAQLAKSGNLEGIGSAEEPWDGIETTYFDSVAGFKAYAKSAIARRWFEAEQPFIDHERSVYVLTRRHVIKHLIR